MRVPLPLHSRPGIVRRSMVPDSDNPDKGVILTEVDCEPILDSIKAHQDNARPGADVKLAARIPIHIAEQAFLERWDSDRWKAWLNNPDNPWRVWKGRV